MKFEEVDVTKLSRNYLLFDYQTSYSFYQLEILQTDYWSYHDFRVDDKEEHNIRSIVDTYFADFLT